MATQSWVNRDYRRGLRTHPCGGPNVEVQRGGNVVSYLHYLGAAGQKVQDHRAWSRPRVSSLMMSLEGTMVLKAVVNEQPL